MERANEEDMDSQVALAYGVPTLSEATTIKSGVALRETAPSFRGLYQDTLAEQQDTLITRNEHEDLRADHRRAVASLASKGIQIGRLQRQRERSEQQIRKAHRLIDALDVHVKQLESALRYVVDRWMSTVNDNTEWRHVEDVLAAIGTETPEGLSKMPYLNNSALESVLTKWEETVFDINHRPIANGGSHGGEVIDLSK